MMTLRRYDDTFTCKIHGYDSPEDYWKQASCFHNIGKIKTPTIFINALDDPLIDAEAIDYDIFKNNPYTAIVTTEHGGHLGYHEGILPGSTIWLFEPLLAFLTAIDRHK